MSWVLPQNLDMPIISDIFVVLSIERCIAFMPGVSSEYRHITHSIMASDNGLMESSRQHKAPMTNGRYHNCSLTGLWSDIPNWHLYSTWRSAMGDQVSAAFRSAFVATGSDPQP